MVEGPFDPNGGELTSPPSVEAEPVRVATGTSGRRSVGTDRPSVEVEPVGGATATPALPDSAAPGWLTPGVRGIGAASLLSDLGHEIPTTLLPAFLSSVLGAPAAALGLIEGLADGLSGLAKIVGGPLADEPGRRRSIAVGGYTVTAVLSAAIGLATATWQVAILRTGAWVSRGFRTPARNALLADAVDRRAYGRAYGFERAMDNLGAVLGPLAALALVSLFDVRTAILVSVAPGLLAGLAIVYAIRHIHPASPGPMGGAPAARPGRRGLDLPVRSLLQGRLRRAFVVVGAFEIGNVAATLLILRATEVFAAARRPDAAQLAVALYVAYNLAGTLASVPFGRLGDARGFGAPLLAGFGLFAVAYAFFAIGLADPLLLGAAFVAAGVGIGIAETSEHAIVASAAPPEVRGSAFGLLAAAQSFGDLAASGIVGILWTLAGGTIAFAYAAAWMVVALAATIVLRPGRATAS